MDLKYELVQIRDRLLRIHNSALIIEDDTGGRWIVTKATVIGLKTDDPALILKIRQ